MTVKTGYKALLEAAEAEIETLTTEQAAALLGDDDVQFVDIRDLRELHVLKMKILTSRNRMQLYSRDLQLHLPKMKMPMQQWKQR